MTAKAETIRLDHIRVLFFVRTALNEERVEFFRQLYSENEAVTPITVAKIPGSKGAEQYYELIAGRHRVEGCAAAGFLSIQAFVEKFATEEDKILHAVAENVGGSMPPTTADYEHSMELLINSGMTKKDIVESFPLPKAISAKFYKLTLNKIYKRTVRKAVDAVLKGDISVKDASDKFKVHLEDLKKALNSRESDRDTSISKLLSQLDFPFRSLGQSIGQKAKILIEAFESGEASNNDLEVYRNRIRTSIRHLNRNVENICGRFEAAMNPPEPTTTMSTSETIAAVAMTAKPKK